MTKDVKIEAGTLFADVQQRIVSGLLLPFGELGSTNLGKFSVEPGAVRIPEDADVVTLNVQHDREEPVGRAVELTETPAGIVGTFKIANTPEGDTVLAEIAEGSRSKLSAEVKNVVIRSRKAVSGILFGAAVVEQGAFPSAALMAEYAEDTESEAENVEDNTLKAEIVEVLPSPDDNTEEIVVTDTPDRVLVDEVNADTGEVSQTEFVPAQPTEGDNMAQATAPDTLQAQKAAPKTDGLATVLNELAGKAKTGSRSLFAEIAQREDARAATSLFGALSDVEFDSVGSAGINTAQPQWLGELWLGRTYERKYIPLISSGSLTALTMQAWRWTTRPEVAVWDGNKSAVPTNVPATESFEVTGVRYAGAHDYAREFRDFGRTDVIESALRGLTESYAKKTDIATVDALVAGATGVTASAADAWNRIIDGVEAIIDTAVPTFAILAPDMYRSLLLTQDSDKLAYLNAAMGIESGSAAGFIVVPSAELSAGQVLVGAREAATSFELAGAPIRAEATDMVLGGFDIGIFGYHAVAITNENALALVSTGA